MRNDLSGVVKGVYRAEDPKTLVSSAQEELELTLEGVVGDRHYGYTRVSGERTTWVPRGTILRNSRQVSIVSIEELAEVARRMAVPEILPEWLGANLLIAGIPSISLLPPATRLTFPQGTILVVMGENHPCTGPGRVIQTHYPDHPDLISAFPRQALLHRGIVAWVERSGLICPGETMTVSLPTQRIYSIPEE
ncbi:MAG TPA: hypothetical protein VHO48_11285 [Anaerolineaceae bacterium]|nr:hypothetical protein [Anaerolineaceae bacterium]